MQLLTLLAVGSLTATVLYYLLSRIYGLLFSPLRSIPGPLPARFSKLWYLFHVYAGRFEWLNMDLHRRYKSPVVRVAPNWYSISDPSALKQIYGPGSKFTKSTWYAAWDHPALGSTLFTYQNNQIHAQERKKFQGMYSMSALVSYESYVDECAGIFVERLKDFAAKGDSIDMAHWFQCYAFDVIGDITYSKRLGFLERTIDVEGVLSALDSNLIYSTLVGIYAKLHPIIFGLLAYFPDSGAGGRTYLIRFGEKMIKEREEEQSVKVRGDMDKDIESVQEDESGKPTDMLAKFLNDFYSGKIGWTKRNVLTMCMSNIIAGSDTTAVSLSSILYYLLKNPRSMQRLRAEIEDCEREGACGNPNVSFKESQNMPYLQAVIKEGLRLHPAVGLPLWRIVPDEGAEICGRRFKGGDVVGASCWVTQYDKDVFGQDAAEFRPERWLDEKNEQKLREMERSWIPFGMGSRTCIGKNISMLEMCKLIPQLVRRFEFHLDRPDKPWTTSNYWFVKQTDFTLTVKLRDSKV